MSYEIMATFGMSISIDAAAAERFAIALRDAKQTRLLNRIFDQQIRYTLAADASSIIRSVHLSKPLLALYSQNPSQQAADPDAQGAAHRCRMNAGASGFTPFSPLLIR